MRARSLQIVAALGLAAGLSGCNPVAYSDCYGVQCPYQPVYPNSDARAYGEPPFDDPAADYTRRSLTISPGAGDSQAANTALQTTTPWPRYSSDTNIPGNGARMVRAINQFESGKRPPLAEPAGGGSPGLQINNISGGTPGSGAPQ
jgi:hypothetical protein